MGESRHIKRMQPVRATPEGAVTVEDVPVPVAITLRFTTPPLDYREDGWVIAWTPNAVLCFWQDHNGEGRSGWLPPRDVTRKPRRGDSRPNRR